MREDIKSMSSLSKNWIDPFEGIETSIRPKTNFPTFCSKNWIDPFEGIETLQSSRLSFLQEPRVRIELTRLRGLRRIASNLFKDMSRHPVRIELTRLRGLRLMVLFFWKETKLYRKNWIDPFEGIETIPDVYCIFIFLYSVRIELTRLRGLRRMSKNSWKYILFSRKNWIDPFEGIETFLGCLIILL